MKWNRFIFFVMLLLSSYLFSGSVMDWGSIRYVHSTTNIRNGRSTKSEIVGKLELGEKVKVDYLKDNWYAVFKVEETFRSEGKAIGYVYAPLLKPTPPKSARPSKKIEGILDYKIVGKEDVSYRGTARMVFRVVVKVTRKPSEEQLRKTAIQIWENGNRDWEEFTVFMYLPEM